MQADETYAIIGAAMEVHRHLGHGFLEALYQHALALEFTARLLPFQREVNLVVFYKGQALACEYRADFICFGNIVVELKALGQIVTARHSQVINELKATNYSIGLLLNFGAPSLEYRRFIRSRPKDSSADFADSADFCRLGEHPSEYHVFSK